MKYFIKNMLAAGILFSLCSAVSAQQGGTTSDLSITALSVTAAGPVKKTPALTNNANPGNRNPVVLTPSDEILKCTVTIHNNSTTGQSRMTTLVVTLPPDVASVSSTFNAVVNKTGDQNRFGMPGCVVFDAFVVSAGQSLTVDFTFSKSTSANKVGAYVYSACPDPEPANNFKSASY